MTWQGIKQFEKEHKDMLEEFENANKHHDEYVNAANALK